MVLRVNDFWVLFFGDSMAFFNCKDAAVNGLSRYVDRIIKEQSQRSYRGNARGGGGVNK